MDDIDYKIQMGCQVSGGTMTHEPRHKYPINLLRESSNSNFNPEVNKDIKMMKTYSSLQSKLNDSIAFYSQIIEQSPTLSHPFDALGNPEDEIGFHDGNIETWYRQSRQSGILNGNPFDSLSLCYSLKKDVTQGRIWYQSMVKKYPKSLELHFGMGNIYYKLGLYEESQKSYRRCIDLNPRFDKAYQCIANIYCFKLYDNSHAEEWAKFTLKINPKNVYAALILAIVDYEPKRRLKTLSKLNQNNPKYTRIHNTIGVTYLQSELLDSAIVWFQNGYKINPNYYALACGLAIAFNRKNKYDEAIKWSLAAHELNESHPEPCLNLGDAFKGKGDIQNARAWYQKCIQTNPQSEDPYFKLASLYEKSEPEKAIHYIQQGLQKNQSNTQGLYALGRLYADKKEYAKAIDVLQQLNSIDSGNFQWLFLLGKVYQSSGKSDESLKYFLAAVSKSINKQSAKDKILQFYNKSSLIEKAKQFCNQMLPVNQ